jgi:P4 family phage/plasmid primase-like protien
MPTAEEKASWLRQHARCNIGLVCGPASGVVAIDLDSTDPRARRVIDMLLDKSPYERFGKKGAMFAYRYNGERSFKIVGVGGDMIIECLSAGNQFVLPHSIHPDTGRAYVSNAPLYEVCTALPTLPKDVESILREGLKAQGIELRSAGGTQISMFVPAGARDNAMVSHAGILSRAIIRGERSVLDALGEIKHWVETYTEKVAGDDVSVEKAQAKVVEFLQRDVLGRKRRGLREGWDEGLTVEDKEKMGLHFSELDEQWSMDRIVEHLSAEFVRFDDPQSSEWNRTVEFALARIARSNLTSLEEGRLLKFINSRSKGNDPLPVLKRRLSELRQGDIRGETHKEIAKQALKDLSETGELRFDVSSFWQWKGASWEALAPRRLEGFITEEYGDYPGCKKNADARGIVNAMRGLAVKELAQSPVRGVNFANGFLTEDLQLLPHSPDFGATYVLPYRYRPEDTHCPMFMQLLDDYWGGDADFQDKILALQEALAATIVGIAPRYQRAFLLFGQPGSGKSRIPAILEGLLPGGCRSNVSPSDWGDKFLPAELHGKLLNVAGEISERRKIAGDIFKQIVEGASITAQHKNQAPFTFQPRAAHWFCGNHLPLTDDYSGGFTRRWLILVFNKLVAPDRKNVDIAEIILAQEREQIAAWALSGLDRLKGNKDYTLPPSHKERVAAMTMKNNPVFYFLSENKRLRVGEGEHAGCVRTRTKMLALHQEYWTFCLSTGASGRVAAPQFTAMMDEYARTFGYVKHLSQRGSTTEVEYEFITIEDVRP